MYVRGQAYLAARQCAAAAAEFQKILDHSGLVWNCWTGALARLSLARAYALAAATAQGTDVESTNRNPAPAYLGFFELWKGADANVPILLEARTEAAALH